MQPLHEAECNDEDSDSDIPLSTIIFFHQLAKTCVQWRDDAAIRPRGIKHLFRIRGSRALIGAHTREQDWLRPLCCRHRWGIRGCHSRKKSANGCCYALGQMPTLFSVMSAAAFGFVMMSR